MRYITLFIPCLAAIGQQVTAPPIQDLNVLIGKQVIVQRTVLCPPGTFAWSLAYAGKHATVISLKPSNPLPLTSVALSRLPVATRALLENQQKAATILVRFEDGSELDTCMPIGPSSLPTFFELVPGQTLEVAKVSAPTPEPTLDPNTSTLAPTPALDRTIIGKHMLGETVQDWFADEEINLELACQQNLPVAVAQLREVFLKQQVKAKDLKEKLKAKELADLCQALFQIQLSGEGTLKHQNKDIMIYTLSHGKLAAIQRSMPLGIPLAALGGKAATAAGEIQFLIDKFGNPASTKSNTYQNGFGATKTALEAIWILPNGGRIHAEEKVVDWDLQYFEVYFFSKEYLSESLATTSKSPNPYSAIIK